MRTILFTFRSDVPLERQVAIIDEIRAWDGVIAAGRLYPDETSNPDMLRRCYAYTEDWADLDALVRRVAALPEVENAFVPPERGPL